RCAGSPARRARATHSELDRRDARRRARSAFRGSRAPARRDPRDEERVARGRLEFLQMSSRRLAVLLAVALLIVLGPFVGPDTAQPASRYDLTASLAEHGSRDLAPYRHPLGVDRATYRAPPRADPGSGQPDLA